jgi:hypothetical protein
MALKRDLCQYQEVCVCVCARARVRAHARAGRRGRGHVRVCVGGAHVRASARVCVSVSKRFSMLSDT